MKHRMPLGLLTLFALSVAFAAPHPVAADNDNKPLKHIVITGTGEAGTVFDGRFDIENFVQSGENILAIGELKGKLIYPDGRQREVHGDAAFPVSLSTTAPASAAAFQLPGSVPILHLVLGPLDLNLLGLHVELNQVVLDITAETGPGNLLGNLLAAIANLLNGPPAPSVLTQIVGLLNQILGLLG